MKLSKEISNLTTAIKSHAAKYAAMIQKPVESSVTPQQPKAIPKQQPKPATQPASVETPKTTLNSFSAPSVIKECTPTYNTLQTVEIEVAKITLSEDVPQFKSGSNKSGIVKPLGGQFNRIGIAPIQLWVRNSGAYEVISGRHRFDLAKRCNEHTIPAQLHYESRGFTLNEAKRLDAELNLRDEQGTLADYIAYFKSFSDYETAHKHATEQGLLSRELGRSAIKIAWQSTSHIVDNLINGQISDSDAMQIVESIDDHKQQVIALNEIIAGKSTKVAIQTAIACQVLIDDGNTQCDMFGFDVDMLKTAGRMATFVNKKLTSLRKTISAISGASKNPDIARQHGIDVKDVNSIKQKLIEIKTELNNWINWHTNTDIIRLINDVIAGRQPISVIDDGLQPTLI
jgi:hypothetical protein